MDHNKNQHTDNLNEEHEVSNKNHENIKEESQDEYNICVENNESKELGNDNYIQSSSSKNNLDEENDNCTKKNEINNQFFENNHDPKNNMGDINKDNNQFAEQKINKKIFHNEICKINVDKNEMEKNKIETNKKIIINDSRYVPEALKDEKFNEVDKISQESKKISENFIFYLIALIIILIGILFLNFNKECPKVEVENFDNKFCQWLVNKLDTTNEYDLEQINEIKKKIIPIYKDCSFKISMPKYSKNKSEFYKYRKFSKRFYLEYYVEAENQNYVMT